jgi:hypothetical protein
MAVHERLESLGSWELELAEETPGHVIGQLTQFGHVAIVDGPVDVEQAGDGILTGARYVGVCRRGAKPDSYTRSGVGMVFWLADEDGKGHTLLTEVTFTNATLADVVAALKPPTVTTGTVHPQADPAVRWTGTHFLQSRREALAQALSVFGAELRVNGDASIDVGTPAQLYNTEAPDRIIKRRAVGSDVDLTAVGGDFDSSWSVEDYSTDITVVGQTIGTGDEPGTAFVLASAAAASVPHLDPQGNPVKLTRIISASAETEASAPVTAALNVNRFARTQTALKVTAETHEVHGTHRVGDAVYVYDPATGITDPAREVLFRGEVLHPDVVRVSAHTWPILEGMTVAWRTDAGVWIDLTRWVVWETAGWQELTVGDLPKTLTASSNPVLDRVDAARGLPSAKTPKAPIGLLLTTASGLNSAGGDSSVITATWEAVTQYVDNTTVALSHYEIESRPTFRAPQWSPSSVTAETTKDLPVVAALAYDVRVRAVSTGGVASDWSTIASITSAADAVAPAAPSDPVVTPYLGILRIYWNGLNSLGAAMPADFNRVDVHVGDTAGFAASAATLVSSLSVAGYAHAQAPYGSAKFARFIAYDHNGNASAASGTISGTAVQAGDGDIAALSVGKLTAGIMSADVTISGRFATALTGARVEVNALGLQKFAADNSLLVNITGAEALLTGIFKTALTGRRIEMGAGGTLGEITFWASDGKNGFIKGFTGVVNDPGTEAIRMGITPETTGIWGGWTSVQAEGTAVGQSEIFMTSAFQRFTVGGDGPETGKSWNVSYASDRGTTTAPPTRLDRMVINVTSNKHYFPDTGNFTVFERLSDNSARARLDIGANLYRLYDGDGVQRLLADDGDYTRIVAPSAQGITLQSWDGSTRADRFWFNADNFYLQFRGTNRRLEFLDFSSSTNSPLLKILNASNYGVTLFYNDDGSGSNHRAEFKDAGLTVYTPLWAASFVQSSSGKTKEDVRNVGPGALAKIRAIRYVDFTRKASAHGKGPESTDGRAPAQVNVTPPGPSRREVGVIAEEVEKVAPELIVHGQTAMRDIGSELALVGASIQELATIVDELRKGRAA